MESDGRSWETRGRQDLVTEALLADEEVGLYLRNHLAILRYYQMGNDEAGFVFWNDCSGS